jgi:ankyrin repeat protein
MINKFDYAAYGNNHALVKACVEGDINTFKRLLADRSIPKKNAEWPQTLLQIACKYNQPTIVAALLAFPTIQSMLSGRNGYSDNDEDTRHSAMLLAAKNGNIEVVQLLLNSGYFTLNSINDTTHQHSASMHSADITPLHIAVENNHYELVEWLLTFFPQINTSRNGLAFISILMTQIKHTANLSAERLNIKQENDFGNPLHIACMKGHVKIVELLLPYFEDEINLKAKHYAHKLTPLEYACQQGHDSVVDILLNHPLIVVNSDTIKITIEAAQISIAEKLIKRNKLTLSSDIVKILNEHLLKVAPIENSNDVINWLLNQNNVDINHENDEGQIPLILAMQAGQKQAVELLWSKYNKSAINSFKLEHYAVFLKLTLSYIHTSNKSPEAIEKLEFLLESHHITQVNISIYDIKKIVSVEKLLFTKNSAKKPEIMEVLKKTHKNHLDQENNKTYNKEFVEFILKNNNFTILFGKFKTWFQKKYDYSIPDENFAFPINSKPEKTIFLTVQQQNYLAKLTLESPERVVFALSILAHAHPAAILPEIEKEGWLTLASKGILDIFKNISDLENWLLNEAGLYENLSKWLKEAAQSPLFETKNELWEISQQEILDELTYAQGIKERKDTTFQGDRDSDKLAMMEIAYTNNSSLHLVERLGAVLFLSPDKPLVNVTPPKSSTHTQFNAPINLPDLDFIEVYGRSLIVKHISSNKIEIFKFKKPTEPLEELNREETQLLEIAAHPQQQKKPLHIPTRPAQMDAASFSSLVASLPQEIKNKLLKYDADLSTNGKVLRFNASLKYGSYIGVKDDLSDLPQLWPAIDKSAEQFSSLTLDYHKVHVSPTAAFHNPDGTEGTLDFSIVPSVTRHGEQTNTAGRQHDPKTSIHFPNIDPEGNLRDAAHIYGLNLPDGSGDLNHLPLYKYLLKRGTENKTQNKIIINNMGQLAISYFEFISYGVAHIEYFELNKGHASKIDLDTETTFFNSKLAIWEGAAIGFYLALSKLLAEYCKIPQEIALRYLAQAIYVKTCGFQQGFFISGYFTQFLPKNPDGSYSRNTNFTLSPAMTDMENAAKNIWSKAFPGSMLHINLGDKTNTARASADSWHIDSYGVSIQGDAKEHPDAGLRNGAFFFKSVEQLILYALMLYIAHAHAEPKPDIKPNSSFKNDLDILLSFISTATRLEQIGNLLSPDNQAPPAISARNLFNIQ